MCTSDAGDEMSDLEGVLLSEYLLLQCISRGGVTDVYRGRHDGDEPYEVVVKIYRPEFAQRGTFRQHFLTEAEKIGQLDHPHILPLLEYGEGDGLLYAVTPFISTGTLQDLLERVGGRFSAMQVLPIMQQLCSAVQYAHTLQVTHGNIKPGNIFVAADGRMLLADFGISSGYDDSQQSLTRVGWGSAEYASPEQSLGVLRPSSDIYALGVLCYRLLTGTPPFIGQTPVEVLLKHVRQEVPSARTHVANISDAVDAVLLKALAKRADDRYTNAEAFYQALQEAVKIAPVASPLARNVPGSPTLARLPSVSKTVPLMQTPLPASAPDPQTPLPASLVFMPAAAAPTRPLAQEEVGQTMQFSFAETRVLPPSRVEPPLLPPGWSSEPPEWSPIASEPVAEQAGAIPLTASGYLREQAVPLQEDGEQAQQGTEATQVSGGEQVPAEPSVVQVPQSRLQRWLPIIVVIMLLLGLAGAIISSFFFPTEQDGFRPGNGQYMASMVTDHHSHVRLTTSARNDQTLIAFTDLEGTL